MEKIFYLVILVLQLHVSNGAGSNRNQDDMAGSIRPYARKSGGGSIRPKANNEVTNSGLVNYADNSETEFRNQRETGSIRISAVGSIRHSNNVVENPAASGSIRTLNSKTEPIRESVRPNESIREKSGSIRTSTGKAIRHSHIVEEISATSGSIRTKKSNQKTFTGSIRTINPQSTTDVTNRDQNISLPITQMMPNGQKHSNENIQTRNGKNDLYNGSEKTFIGGAVVAGNNSGREDGKYIRKQVSKFGSRLSRAMCISGGGNSRQDGEGTSRGAGRSEDDNDSGERTRQNVLLENVEGEVCTCGRTIGQRRDNEVINGKTYDNTFYIDRMHRILHGRNRHDRICYAIKSDCYNRNEIPALRACMAEPRCRNIYELIDADNRREICVFRFGYISLHEMYRHGVRNYGLSCPIIRAEITAGLNQLHAKGWEHADLKSENVMLFEKPEGEEGYDLKLIDLGNAISEQDYQQSVQLLQRLGRQMRWIRFQKDWHDLEETMERCRDD